MSNELTEGVELQQIVGLYDPQEGTGIWVVGENPGQCKRIVVVEQRGQMSMVPWAKMEMRDGTVTLINLANVEGVTLATKDESEEGTEE